MLRSGWLILLVAAALTFGANSTALNSLAQAQETTQPQTDEESAAADAADEGTVETRPVLKTLPPAYESQMLRLAEVLGSLHYLRELCGAGEGQTWRDEMAGLLEAESPSDERKAQLIAHFNRGFRGYQEIYRECTTPASEAANQFLNQGMRLAAEIPNRFGR
jgi:uncharacterized protein (TIGR02301 family)